MICIRTARSFPAQTLQHKITRSSIGQTTWFSVEIKLLNFDAIAGAPVTTEPISCFIVPGVLSAVDLAAVRADLPPICGPGEYSLSELIYGPAFARLVDEIITSEFKSVVEKKYGINDAERGEMVISVCNQGGEQNQVPTFKPDVKTITCLFYLNSIWSNDDNAFRGADDYNSFLANRQLSGGTLASFITGHNSEHLHRPNKGELSCVTMTWNLVQHRRDDLLAAVGMGNRGHHNTA